MKLISRGARPDDEIEAESAISGIRRYAAVRVSRHEGASIAAPGFAGGAPMPHFRRPRVGAEAGPVGDPRPDDSTADRVEPWDARGAEGEDALSFHAFPFSLPDQPLRHLNMMRRRYKHIN